MCVSEVGEESLSEEEEVGPLCWLSGEVSDEGKLG